VATALVVAVLVAAGCAELERPEGFSQAPPTSLVIGEGQVFESGDQEQAEEAEAVDNFVPSPPADYQPQVIVAASPTPLLAGPTGSTPLAEPLAEIDAARIVDDLGGGLVVETVGGPVLYYQSEQEPREVAGPDAELLDVGFWGGSPRAFVKVDDDEVDWIQLVSEQESEELERQNHFQLAPGEIIVDLSASRDIQAVAIGDDECGTLRFYGDTGTDLALPGPEDPECTFPGRPTYGAVALSPDGEAVAYTIISYRGDGTEAATELVVRELLAEDPFFPRRRIGEDLDRITSLSFDGNRVVYAKESGDDVSVTMLTLIGGNGRETPIALGDAEEVRSVSFARLPLALG
jgi:hypothetical protein